MTDEEPEAVLSVLDRGRGARRYRVVLGSETRGWAATEREATADELAADHDQILRLRGGSLGALDDMVVGSVVPTLSAAYRSLALKYLDREALVLATGGLAELVCRHSVQIDENEPLLTLEGLRIVHELNAGRVSAAREAAG